MNRFLRLVLVAMLAAACLSAPASVAQAASPMPQATTLVASSAPSGAAAGVIAKPKAGVTMGAAALSAGQQGKPVDGGDVVTYPTPAGQSPESYAAALRATGRFDYVTPNYVLSVSDYTATPNDPDFNDPTSYMTPSSPGVDHAKSWALRGPGSSDFDQVWAQLATDGRPYHARVTGDAVPVAVVDTGFFLDQNDCGRIVGKKDCFDTYSSTTGLMTTDSDVSPVSPTAPLANPTIVAHGTMTASEIAEAGNNGVGGVGASYDGEVWVYKVQGIWTEGDGTGAYPAGCAVILDSAVIDAIRTATDDGAKVISMSFGGSNFDPAMQDAIDYAWSKGVVIVAAVGNTGSSGVQYPAAYDHVIGVGSYSLAGGPPATQAARSSFSTYGPGLDILAPGDYIWGPDEPGYTGANSAVPGYCWWQGTSMSAPFVAAAASLLLRFEPGLTPDDVEGLLESSATSLDGTGYNTNDGWGKLDVQAAYERLKGAYPLLDRPALSGIAPGGTYATHDFTLSWAPVAGDDVSYAVTGDWSATPLYSGTGTSAALNGVPDGVHTVTVSPTSARNWSDASSVSAVTFGVNASPPTGLATSLSLGTSAPAIGSGAPLTLSGLLLTAAGDGIAGGTIALSRSSDGGATWQLIGSAQTDGLGAWSFIDVPDRDYLYEASYAGDVNYCASNSSAVSVSVSAGLGAVPSLTIRSNRRIVHRGQAVTLSGLVAPGQLVGAAIRLEVRRPGCRRWAFLSERILYRGQSGLARWVYRQGIKRRMTRGSYQFRAIYYDGNLPSAQSPVIWVRVK